MSRLSAWIVALACVWATTFSGRGDLILNTDFEVNQGFGGGTADSWINTGRSGIEGWSAHSGSWGLAVYGFALPETPYYGTFYQVATGVQAGNDYGFSIWANKDDNFTAAAAELSVEWYDIDSLRIGGVTNNVYSSLNTSWQQFTVSGTAPANATTLRVQVNVTGINDGGALKFDEANLTVVPEPGAFTLSVVGMVFGLAVHRLRRRA